MAKDKTYKEIKHLIAELAKNSQQLENGELSAEDMELMAEDARDLYERIIVIRHLAFERLVKNDGSVNEVGEPPLMPFKINMKAATISENQTSLIDVIEELTSDSPEETTDTFHNGDKSEEDPMEGKEDSETLKSNSSAKPSEDHIKTNSAPSQNNPSPAKDYKGETPKALSEDSVSLNERASKQERKPTVAEKLKKSRITDLRKAIGLNQKFQFINELFEGDSSEYDKVIEILNTSENWEAAKDYFDNTLLAEKDWEEEHPSVLDFRELVERRYL